MPEPLTINAQDSLVDAARCLRAWDVSEVFVVDDDHRLVGRLTDRDIAVVAIAAGRHPATLTAGECCDTTPQTVTMDDSAAQAADLMRRHGLQRLPVVRNHHFVGTVWAADLPTQSARPSPSR